MSSRPIPGAWWRPNAAEHARFQRVADDYQRALLSIGVEHVEHLALRFGPGVCRLKNVSGANRNRFDLLGIDATWGDPVSDLEPFQAYLPLSGTVPTFPAHDGRFAVLLEPAAPGQLAFAIISGLAVVQIDVPSGTEWYTCADITDNDASKLTLLPSGAAQVLWKEDGMGSKWAIVRLGNPATSPTLFGKTDAQIAAGGSGAVSIWLTTSGTWSADNTRNVTAYAPPVLSTGHIDAGDWVAVTWMPAYRKWVITAAECEVQSSS